ncbi:type II secretion system protein [Acinetobacter proteolyticus]|uniref:General secretion pathway protein GspG n=1 Tax=Acinetobacter proteolyticus TaxID=1776741 RepID=A0A2N0WFF3_9GAMM|nr:type II secretion system protein [Acinetobacter proteolyticus]PKF33800.1 general secretion pathway protein GspG [Acinetobacter proteolyticus]
MTSRSVAGFTLIELIVTVSLMAILASVIVPITQLSMQQVKEQELKSALKEIRTAIDAYKQAGDNGHIYRSAETTGYPTTLNELVDGVVDIKDPKKRKIYFLRRIPADPFYEDPSSAADKTWGIRSYRNELDHFKYEGDVYDVYSLSIKTGLNGRPYKDW